MKFKTIPNDYYSTILDRLTRLTPANVRYKRVFDDIINKFYTEEKLKNLSVEKEISIVEKIINQSLCNHNESKDKSYALESNSYNEFIYMLLREIEDKYYKFNSESYQYLSSRLNYSGMLSRIELTPNSPKNLVWLKRILDSKAELSKLREEESLLYPVEKIILCEGQTEYVLLSVIFKLFGYDFDKLGYVVIAAGGKNQVARKYYSMCEEYKIPLYILLDSDALQIKTIIDKKLRKIDKLYIIKNGEFEDLIPVDIIKNALNNAHKNESNCSLLDFEGMTSMVESLDLIYKKYGFGDFKKAYFAQILKEYIEKNCSSNDFKDSEVNELIEFFI